MALTGEAQIPGLIKGGPFAEYALFNDLSAAMVYLDLVTAFASVMRELLYTDALTDQRVCYILAKFNMPGESFADLCRILQGQGSLQFSGAGAHLAAIIRSTLTSAWFTTPRDVGPQFVQQGLFCW